MKKIYFALGAAVAALAIFAGCTRDMVTSMNSLTLETENYKNSDAKAYISDGNAACWEDNDQIKLTRNRGDNLTHYDGSISITHPEGSNRADVVADGFNTEGGDVIYACYPQTKFSDGVTDPASITVTMPSEYQYVVTNGKQKIEAPMIGKLTIQPFEEGQTNRNIMKLKNLCTLLKITLEAPTVGAFSVDKIAVTSSDVTLNGPATINFSGDAPTLTMNNPYNHGAENDCVVLNFGDNAVGINGTKVFFIPVPPLPSGQTLKIWIHNAISGNWFTRNVTTSAVIPGNTVATLNGPATNDPDAGYRFFSYIRNSNNSSYIRLTGVKPNYGQKMELTFLVESGITSSQYYAGSRAGASGSMIYYGLVNTRSANDFRACFMSQDAVVDPENYATSGSNMLRQNNTIYRQAMEIKQEASGYYRGHVTFERLDNSFNTAQIITAQTTTDRDASLNEMASAPDICIFKVGNSYQPAGMRMYAFKIWDASGTLLKNFVPAQRVSDGAIGVYDMVGKTFIIPNGTFTLGN